MLGTLCLLLLGVIFVLCRYRPIYWIDVWWHLATGQYIIQHHRVPLVDVFSWTVRGARWINTEWLYEVVLYACWRAMGMSGIIFLKLAWMLTALYFLDRRLRLWKAGAIERLGILGWVYLGAWPFWVERSDLTSLALVSALLLEMDRIGTDPCREMKNPLRWVLVFALWPNLHGAFPLGLAITGVYGAILLSANPRAGGRILAWTTLFAAATLINPYGVKLPAEIFRLMSGNEYLVAEWYRPRGPGFSIFFASVALAAASLIKRKRWTTEDLYAAFIILAFSGYALCHERFVHFFMVAAFPYAVRPWLQSHWHTAFYRRVQSRERPILAFSACLLALIAAFSARWARGGVDVAESAYVKDACDFIVSERITGPFFNDYRFGSYWIWRFKGNPPVFQDGRHLTVAGYERLMEAAQQAQGSPHYWGEFLDHWGVQAALVRYPSLTEGIRPSPLDHFFPRTSWGLVYWDDLCLLFVRRTARNSATLKHWEYRVIKPDWTLATFQDQLRRGAVDRRALRVEIERCLRLRPSCWRARVDWHWLDQIRPSKG
jgi:hypothetical protein